MLYFMYLLNSFPGTFVKKCIGKDKGSLDVSISDMPVETESKLFDDTTWHLRSSPEAVQRLQFLRAAFC